jgi:dephospho-CoA kinase
MIIGLTGSMGCGKGEIVNILNKMGFEYITLSMMVREEARKRGVPEEREHLMEVGNSMRKAEGAGVLALRAAEKIKSSGHDKWVVDGIRNPAEIDELKKENDVYIFGVHTDKDILVNRILSRNRESDAKEKSEILRKIEREWGKDEPEDGQQVGKCMQKVDFTITNEGALEDHQKNFMDYYNKIKK